MQKLFCSLVRRISISRSLNKIEPTMKVRPNAALKKIDTPEFKSIFTDELRTLINYFSKYNYELRIAGGAVRDILMNIQPKDIDLATTATPEQMKEMFTKEDVRMINTKGEKHGTITPRIHNKENFEVTTLRVDVVTDGRHAEVEFTTDWQLDANRRDLTINSMFLGFDGTVYDYFYGYEDLQERRVVFVGRADVRIQEDYLRILRYFRFYGRIAKFPNKHDEDTVQAICNNISGLQRVSGERIWSEMQKIFQGNFVEDITMKMLDCGIAPHIGLPLNVNVEEFKRVSSALDRIQKPHHSILYMVALLNNNEDVMRLHQRLKLSAFERDCAIFISEYREKVDCELVTLKDFQMLCIQRNIKQELVEELLKYCGKNDLYQNFNMPKFPITGNILQERNCPGGAKMGMIMMKLKLIWAENDFQLTKDELLDVHLPKLIEEFATVKVSPGSLGRKRKKQNTFLPQ